MLRRRTGAPTSYWELKLNERLMESVVKVSALTDGGGKAAAEEELDFFQKNIQF